LNLSLNHLNLCVPDVADARRFFETYFDFRCIDLKGDALAVLEGANGFTLVISNFKKDVTPVYPDAFHIGFIVESPEQVQAMYERLQQGGIEMYHEPRTMRGSLLFYCYAPGAILLEVSCRL
jgi:catechol 2,3-dioxygenase-like lactoylglutathione lyase family enzyme